MGNPKGVKRDFQALEKRRFEAMRLLDQGLNQCETARRLKVARQTVSAWRRQYRRQGVAGLRRAGRAGRKPLLDAAQRERLTALLLEGPEAHGFPTPLWTCPRVARLIGDEFGVDYHEGHVWKILRGLGWSPQRPVGRARERNEAAIRSWQRKTWPGIKKKAHNEGRTLVFIDESGLSQKPHRCRSWAPRGQTPVLQFNFNWQKLSVAAGLTLRNFYFRLYPGAIGQVEVIDFLKALVRHIDQPLLIVWDRLPAHRSRLVREFIELSEGHIVTEYLPPYAPELNPVEYIWSYWKQHELPNVCPKDYGELSRRARQALRRMRRKPRLITAFWKQSSLCFD